MQNVHIHRLSNGTIDIDHYRQRGLSERRATMTGIGGSIGRIPSHVRPMVAIFVVLATLWAIPGKQPEAQNNLVSQLRVAPSHTAN